MSRSIFGVEMPNLAPDPSFLRDMSREIDRGPYNHWTTESDDESYNCLYRLERVIHGLPAAVSPLWLVFPPSWTGGPLVVPFTIHAANLRSKVEGRITILTSQGNSTT